MFFGKKSKGEKCPNCSSKVKINFSFCPHCGESLFEEEINEYNEEDYGLLGRDDYIDEPRTPSQFNLGIADKLIGSLVNSLMKNLDKQIKNSEKTNKPEIKNLPNGIRIRIGPPQKKEDTPQIFRNHVSEEQIKKMSSLPRSSSKARIKRLGDKLIYELNTPGIQSPNDIFVSKLESGYEIKAIGSKKVYVNSLPINLPICNLSLDKNKLLVEFRTSN